MMPNGLPYWHGSPSESIDFTIKFFSISKGHLLALFELIVIIILQSTGRYQ